MAGKVPSPKATMLALSEGIYYAALSHNRDLVETESANDSGLCQRSETITDPTLIKKQKYSTVVF